MSVSDGCPIRDWCVASSGCVGRVLGRSMVEVLLKNGCERA